MSQAIPCTSPSQSSPIDPVEEDKLRTESWLIVASGKKKG